MRSRTKKSIAVAGSLLAVIIAALIIFFARAPVLIVTDYSFIMLYGQSRIRSETFYSSLALFRQIKPVIVTDDAGDDIVQFAVADGSSRPYCVLFPLRFARVARNYREINPDIPVVILEGRYPSDANPASFAIGEDTDDYFLFKTDISADFYRAGLAAVILDGEKDGRIVAFTESGIQSQAREAFLRALNDLEKPLHTSFFTTLAQFSENPSLSCIVMAGAASDYFDKNSKIPVVYFTWLDPELVPLDTVVIFNDSPWIQAVPAVRMVNAGMTKGQIPSKTHVLKGNNIDKNTIRKLRKI
uniref:Uncharacterized protein n=1 Tax=uncultured bacterium contig00015 TaxID=1181506 RepID=A0A806K2R4_9BACT|nr:hypothetical protein [uncultured bacterium contig00015]